VTLALTFDLGVLASLREKLMGGFDAYHVKHI